MRLTQQIAASARRLTFHAVASLVVTWPLLIHVRDRLPLGTESTDTVARFNLWTLRWGADHLVPIGDSYWNAPIFWPARGAFALSEPQPLTSAIFALARLLFGAVAGYSVVLLVGLTLTGVGASLLARRLGADEVPAAIVGVVAQTLPFVFDQLGVLQLTMIWPVFFALAALIAWASDPHPGHAAAFAVAAGALVLSCGNHAFLVGIGFVVAAPVLIERRWRAEIVERLGGLAVAVGVLIGVAALVVLPQQDRLAGYAWQRTTVVAGSAELKDWWAGGRSWPGIVLLLLAIVGLWIGRRQRFVWFLIFTAAVAFAISFGSRLSILGWHPWDALRNAVPAAARLRNPWRATAVMQIAFVGLSSLAIQRIWTSHRAAGRLVVVVSIIVGIATGPVGPGALSRAEAAEPAAVRMLAEIDDGRAVVYFPFAAGPGAATFRQTTAVMNDLLDTGHPLVNGYSGFFPTDHSRMRELTSAFPDHRSLDALSARDVRYALADPAWLESRRDRLVQYGIQVVVDDAELVLLVLPMPDSN